MKFKMEFNHPIQLEPMLSNFIAFFVLIFVLSSVGLVWFPSVEALTERIVGENSAPTSFNFFGIFALLMTSLVAFYTEDELDTEKKFISYFSIYPANFSLGIGSVGSAILLGVGLSILVVRQEVYAWVFIFSGCYVAAVTFSLGVLLQYLVRPLDSGFISQKPLAVVSIVSFIVLFLWELFNIPAKINLLLVSLF